MCGRFELKTKFDKLPKVLNIGFSFINVPIHLNRMSIHIDLVQRQKFYPKF